MTAVQPTLHDRNPTVKMTVDAEVFINNRRSAPGKYLPAVSALVNVLHFKKVTSSFK